MRTYAVTVAVKANSPEDALLVVSPDRVLDLTQIGVEEYEVLAVSNALEIPTKENDR